MKTKTILRLSCFVLSAVVLTPALHTKALAKNTLVHNAAYSATSTVKTAQPDLAKTISTGSSADEKLIWKFLYDRIGNEYGVAALMGNLLAESALRSDNLQNSYEKKLGYNDKTYTEAVDDGSYENFVKDAAGYGLAQWTYWTRKKALLNYVKENNASIGDINAQLEFLWIELNESFASTLAVLKKAQSVREGSDYVLKKFENPADQSEAVKKRRAGYGETFYNKYAGMFSLKKGDLVKITSDKYYNDKKIPEWVLNQNWYVRSIKDDRIVVDISENGKHSIESAISSDGLQLIKSNEEIKGETNKDKTIDDIAKEVINGLWSKGKERKVKLTEAGYDYKTVQKRVNEIWYETHK